MTKYVVIENTPGYLPDDDNPLVTDSFAEAVEYAQGLIYDILDAYADTSSEEYGIPQLAHACRESESLWRVVFNAPHTLDRVVEIIDVDDAIDPDYGEGDTDTEEDRAFVARIENDDALDTENDPATWTIPGDGYADGGTPYSSDELRARE